MGDYKRRLLGLGLPCLGAFLLDTTLRLCAQPEAYWAGNYNYILLEGTPFVRSLFAWHPLAAVCGFALWAAIIVGLLLLLPRAFAVVLSIAVVFGHGAGALSWSLRFMDQVGYLPINGAFLITGIGLGAGLHWYLKSSRHGENKELDLPTYRELLRWGAIMALSGMGCYLFVIGR